MARPVRVLISKIGLDGHDRGAKLIVRNLRDGRVEAVLAGDAAQVEALLDACRRGPPGSRVDGVDVGEADAAGLPETFEIRRDG